MRNSRQKENIQIENSGDEKKKRQTIIRHRIQEKIMYDHDDTVSSAQLSIRRYDVCVRYAIEMEALVSICFIL